MSTAICPAGTVSPGDHKATVYIEEEAVTLIEDGDLLAIRQHGRVEVWNADGEIHLGNLPMYATEPETRKAAEFWLNGFNEGIQAGRAEAQAKIRDALGLGS